MISFFLCLALLIGGYFVYGKVVENTFGPMTVRPLPSRSTTVWTTWSCRSGSSL